MEMRLGVVGLKVKLFKAVKEINYAVCTVMLVGSHGFA